MNNNDLVEGAPSHELTRSPAAALIGRLAAQSNLMLSHFEHRVEFSLPEAWLPVGPADLSEAPGWQNGVLPESKYQAFRHDRMSGSFHPGHRAKWTAHELCHGLVGFAWQPGAGRFFHALAARLAEVLPVALWYFFDEAGLQRCTKHQGQGPLFRTFCPDCEMAAMNGPCIEASDAEKWRVQGRDFVARELSAVRQSIREGQMIPHRVASLDLADDALAYAGAHAERLNSEAFHLYIELYCSQDTGYHADLDSLIAQVEALSSALVEGSSVPSVATDRWNWVAQDLGWRLLQIWTETEGEAADTLHNLVVELAESRNEQGVQKSIALYRDLATEWYLPEAEELFAVGYDLPNGLGHSVQQVTEGLESTLPSVMALLEDPATVVAEFVAQDRPQRMTLGRRFSTFLSQSKQAFVADVACFEAAVMHPFRADLNTLNLVPDAFNTEPDMSWIRTGSGELLDLAFDVPELLEQLLSQQSLLPEQCVDTTLAVVSLADGELGLLSLSQAATEQLQVAAGEPVDLSVLGDEERSLLIEHGLIVPARYC